ncbi:hypothetical protein BM526_19500 (plasmid) [Alteromonas mediterranea]|uniref:hypothetical protein n=1 Tax=Alteromonas mediterranea TaxID=314275 RepID=UPI000904366C|nr:hypothetical protein [Alteromonas mediterranea]APE04156.1 hypothetical protein BM526_19500 [Alteromonas mediterranea]
MNEQYVYTVHQINEWTYEMINETIQLVTRDREQAMSYAKKLLKAPRPSVCYDVSTVVVRETILGVAMEPEDIFREMIYWTDDDEIPPLFSDDDILCEAVTFEEAKLDCMLMDIEYRANMGMLSGGFASFDLSSMQNYLHQAS